MKRNMKQRQTWKRLVASVALPATVALGGNASAFEIDTGNPDVTVRWDNTVRYNLGVRVDQRDPAIGNSAVSDEGTYSFNTGDIVTSRGDLLSELDVVYKKHMGFRLSGAGWYDGAYGSESKSNPFPPLVNIPSYVNHQYSNYTKRYYEGPSAEWLDAFVFGNFDLGTVPTSVKVGRHSLYWGESLFVNGNLHGIAYSQNPLDLQKGFATPGSEAKELFRPLAQVSGQAQITDTFSVAAQWFFEWDSFRYPEGGTYTGPVDFAFNGPDRFLVTKLPNVGALGPLAGAGVGFTRADPANPPSGDWGISGRWSPQWLDGTVGLYYRNFSDMLPQVLVTQVTLSPALPGVGRVPLASGSFYRNIYKDNIDLWGISLAKNIAGVSVGAEFSYRHNTPLTAQILGVAVPQGTPAGGTTPGPIGDTFHGLVNAIGVVPKTPVFDTANWAVELTWSEWSKVTSGDRLFNAVGHGGCPIQPGGRPGDKWDGCATKDYWGIAASFTPTWFQVFPGVDLQAPVTFASGLSGNAATIFGGNQSNGNWTIGVGADIYQKYRFDLKYIDWFGDYRIGNTASGIAVTSQNGFTTLLRDRGFVNLTFKVTF
jgi:uncharacterized protein DUF1302